VLKDFKEYKKLQTEHWINAALLILLALVVICIVILASVPPVSRDALTHHLAIPKLYLKHGGITEIPSVLFSYYPMNLDLLYVIPLYFGSDIAAKFIHFMFALLTACLIYGYLKERLGAVWAIFGVIFFLSLPIIVKLSITVYVDLGLIFFSTAALLSLLKWIENRFQLKFLILSAVCCGLALGTKYNGLVLLLILTLFIPFFYTRISKTRFRTQDLTQNGSAGRIQLKALGFATVFVFIALLVFSPWMIRNYVWKSNPIYPLYDQIFNRYQTMPAEPQDELQALEPDTASQPESQAKPSPWGSLAMRRVIYGESWWEIALIPVRIFFQGQDDNPRRFDGKLNPFLFLLPFFAFFQINTNTATLQTEKKFLMFFALLFVLYTFCTTSIRIRYIAPIISPLVILSMFGFSNMTSAFLKRWKNLPNGFSKSFIIFLGGAVLAYNGLYIVQQFNYVQPFRYLSGQLSRDAYIEKYRPEYSIYQYANRHLTDRSKILGLFLGNRRYYCDRELIFGQNEFLESVHQADSAQILFMDLKETGYTHVIIRFDLFNWWTEKQLDVAKKELLQAFFTAYLEPIVAKNGYGLFSLKTT
jgi:4-amino-4-deoxy-L-arabinose transferase-like glycosyltransferase